MARTANRRMKSEEQLINKESINSFQTAIYARISRDKKEKPSDSIENQIALCESFIQKSEDFTLAGIYKDIAKTGTDFERPDFENLMDEVRMGKVNCIVVKDLSRFGRNYTELGNFIEKIFPFPASVQKAPPPSFHYRPFPLSFPFPFPALSGQSPKVYGKSGAGIVPNRHTVLQ